MSVTNGFILAVILVFLAYMGYRLYRRRKLTTLLTCCAELFSFSLAILSFAYNVQATDIVQACILFFGILLPLVYLGADYRKMMRKIKEQGVFDGFVEKAPWEDGEKPVENALHAGIHPLQPEKPVSEIIQHLDLNKDDIVKNMRKSLNHAGSFLAQKKYEEALEIYSAMTRLIGNCPALFFNQANLNYYLQKYSDALQYYKKVLEVAPEAGYEQHTAYYNMANAQYRLGRYDQAVNNYKKALEINPTLDQARENIAVTLLAKGDQAEALKYYTQIAGQDDRNPRVYYTLGKIYSDMRRNKEAEEAFRKSLVHNVRFKEGWEELGRLLSRQGRHQDAMEAYNKLLQQYPEDQGAFYSKGVCCYKLGQRQEAVDCFRKAIELNPQGYRSYFNMAVALDEMGQTEEAILAFRKAIGIKSDFIDAYNNLGIVLSTQGRHRDAIEVYMQGIRKNPEEHSLFFNLGMSLSEAGKFREALEAYKNALELKPDEAGIQYHMASVLMEMKKYDEAVNLYKSVLKVKPEDSDLFYNIATVYSLLKRYDIAADNLKRAIELNEEIRKDARINRAFDGMRARAEFRELVS